nr:alpha amylase N-terminal ig-like domain-containing protein [Anaerolineae bacterium]
MSRWFRTWRVSTFAAFLLVLMVTAIQPSFTAFASCGPNNVCWSELYHDSRDPLYRTPTGPAPINSSVTIRFRTAANDVGGVDLRVYNTKLNQNNFFPMAKVATDGTHDYWAYTVNTGATFNILYYWFRINDGSATVFYEDDAASADLNHRFWGGTGAPSANSNDRSWALTVYDPAFTTPDWVKNGVFYQIFPDRFRDGNPANNLPSGTFFYNEAGGTITRSLTTDWNTAICDPRADSNNGCEGSWSRNFYGGDLLGIQNQLQYLKSLGVTVIYMTPIFEAPSNHKYDARDFSVVDDNFGGDAALTALVNAAHAEGMYVVLDGVFNHVSSDSPYFDRYGQYATVGACESANSPYAGLFKPFFPHVPSAQDPTAPCSDNRDYPGWFGFDSLPEFDSATPGGLARQAIWDGGIVHPSGKNAEIGTYWITDFNIDGWRLDVANDVDPSGSFGTNDYWENFRDRVKAADPEAYIVGEFWGIGTQWISGGLANGYTATGSNPGEWDAVMNYQQTSMLMGFWRDSALE